MPLTKPPDLESLKIFVSAATLGSLSKAAAVSPMTVAAASRRVAMLEQRYGERLLVRTSRGVTLTAAGTRFMTNAMRVLECVSELEVSMATHGAWSDDVVRLATNTAAATWFLPMDIASFSARFPSVEVKVSERQSSEVVEAVRNGAADIGIFNDGPRTTGLRCRAYRSDRLAVVVPPQHPLDRKMVRFADVLDFPLVSLRHDGTLSRLIVDQALNLGMTPRLRLEMKSFQSVCHMVRAGLGVAVLPMQPLGEMASHLGLKTIQLSDAWASRSLWICMRDAEQPRRAVHQLLKHLTMETASREPSRNVETT